MFISCSICNVIKNHTQISASRCGHIFHNTCLAERLKQSEYCPLCGSKCSLKKVIPLFLNDSRVIAEPTENILIMENDMNLRIKLHNSNIIIEQLLLKISENESKLDENNKILKLTLESNEKCLSMNSVLKRELEEAEMLNAYSTSSRTTHLTIPQSYKLPVQATAPTWDDIN